MTLQERVESIIAAYVAENQCAGANVLVRRHGKEVLYAEHGMASIEEGRPIQRDSIFRLYSQTKPITAAAVMILAELEESLFGEENMDGEDIDGEDDEDEDGEDDLIVYACPHCGTEIEFQANDVDFDEDYLCPECHKPIFPELGEDQ